MQFNKYFLGVGETLRGRESVSVFALQTSNSPRARMRVCRAEDHRVHVGTGKHFHGPQPGLFSIKMCLSCLIICECVRFFLQSDRKGSP